MLLAVYIIIALAFFFLPSPGGGEAGEAAGLTRLLGML
jgi:hypothetical protein